LRHINELKTQTYVAQSSFPSYVSVILFCSSISKE